MQTLRLPLWLVVIAVSVITGMAISGGLPRAISQDKPAPRHCDVALLDISRVFENFAAFQKEMQRLKADVDSFELVVKQAQADLADTKARMEAAEPGSVNRRTLEIELAQKNASLRAEMEVKRAGFLAKEAATYAVHYRETEMAVRKIAAQHELRLVLRFGSEDFNDKDRTSVMQAISRPVIFHDQLDITAEVIAAINAAG